MVQRDYVSRKSTKKNKSSLNKTMLLSVAVLLIIGFTGGLYFLKQQAKNNPAQAKAVTNVKVHPKTTLPSHLEERWSYIKELETREIPVDNTQSTIAQNAQLSEEQKKLLLQMEHDRKAAEIEKQKQLEQAKLEAEKPSSEKTTSLAKSGESALLHTTPKAVKHSENTTLVESKTEVKKLEAKPVEEPKENAKAIEKMEAVKVTPKETVKEQPKVTAKDQTKEQPKVVGRFGLQCGAFKNKPQAEALQAKLAMSGFNARLVSSSDWNRVFIGPAGDKAAAQSLQANAKNIASCVVISM